MFFAQPQTFCGNNAILTDAGGGSRGGCGANSGLSRRPFFLIFPGVRSARIRWSSSQDTFWESWPNPVKFVIAT